MAVRQALAEWGEQQAAAASGGAPFIGAAPEGGVVDLPLPHEEAAVGQTPQTDAEVGAELWIVETGGDIDWRNSHISMPQPSRRACLAQVRRGIR